MANVRLLRQSINDYTKKFDAANAAYLAGYGDYQAQYDAYSAATNDYNARVAAFNAVGAQAGDIFQNEQGTLSKYGDDGKPIPYTLESSGLNYAGLGGIGGNDAGNSEGGNTQYGEPYKNDSGVWVMDTLQTSPTYDALGNVVGSTTAKTGSITIPVTAYHPGVAPTAPVEPIAPELIKKPNLTVSDIRELQNPGLDQAGLQMSMNRGIIGKSELAGMEQSKNSAFVDPEDPNNLKDVGILARTLGGQLG